MVAPSLPFGLEPWPRMASAIVIAARVFPTAKDNQRNRVSHAHGHRSHTLSPTIALEPTVMLRRLPHQWHWHESWGQACSTRGPPYCIRGTTHRQCCP